MKGSILLFLLLWLFWILLSGFDYQDIIAGGIVSAFIATIVGYGFLRGPKTRYWRGLAWFLLYIPYYIYHEIRANLDVAYRVLSGKINPGIVEVRHSHRHEWGMTTLSNSITMTPGTLTLEAKPSKLYVHWLNMSGDKNKIAGRFERILGRIWD